MKNILMITRPILPPWHEGSKNTAWQIAKNANRHHFHLLTSFSAGKLPKMEAISWQLIYSDNNSRIWQKFNLIWYLFRSKPEVDIYHSLFVPTPITSVLLFLFSRLQGKRFIQTVPSVYSRRLFSWGAKGLFFGDEVVVLSNWTANRLRNLGVRNVTRINAGVDLTRFKKFPMKDVLRKKMGLPKDVPIVLFSGEFHRLGSVEILLAVIPRVIRENPSAHFVIACPIRIPEDIEARRRMQESVQGMGLDESVYFVGEVDDFPGLLNSCDIFIFPVAQMVGKIDTPLTLLEAMAVELPVIFTDLAPLNEVFHDEIGVAVPSGDIVAFSLAILKLVEDAELREKMGKKAREVIQNYYDVNQMVKLYEDLYDGVD